MQKQAGFSIMELMIVITIAAVLASLALPAMKDWQRNANRTAAVTTLLATLHEARSEAVKRDARVTLCPSKIPDEVDAQCSGDKDFATGWILFVDGDADMAHSSDAKEEVLAAVTAINKNFTIFTTKGETALSYKPNGRMLTSDKNDTTDFNVCDDRGADQGRVISITNSGRPQSGSAAADGSVPAC